MLKKFHKSKVLKIKLSEEGFTNNSIFDLLPSIFTRIILCLLLLLLLIFSCKENPTNPNEPIKPPGYQEDIPWPSLANSPWPMNHHDPQSTGRSHYLGPQVGNIQWHFPGNYIQAAASMGNDSIIYFAEAGGLYSLDLNGYVRWNYKIDAQIIMSPLIAKDGTIYFSSYAINNFLIALNPDGTLKWQINLGEYIGEFMMNIDLEGRLYVVAENSLYCISPNSEILWKIPDQRFNSSGNGISFSPDGQTLYIPGNSVSLLAVDITNKSVKWTFGYETLSSPPVVDCNGNVYVIPLSNAKTDSTSYLYSVNSKGALIWKYQFIYLPSTGLILKAPTIDKSGNIYFATDTLFSISYEGKLNWSRTLKGICDCPLVCDIGSNIFVATQSGLEGKVFIYCFDSSGNIKWNLEFIEPQVGPSPAITKGGRLIFCPWRGSNIYYIL